MTAPLRLVSLSLEKYGPFADRVLNFRADAAVHIVLGRNEAGKSVTLRALTDLFCGFPDRIDAEDVRTLRFKRNDLRLGATLLHADGRQLTFRRRPGKAKSLLGASDSAVFDEAGFFSFAGNPERKDFESEFGLTAEALRSGGEGLLAAGGRLAETLAAGSAQLSSLNRIRGELQDEAAKLFLASGRSRKLNEALDRYQAAGRDLRAAVVTGDALKRAQETLAAAEAQAREIRDRLADIERRRALLERARRTRGKLRERADRLARLEAFAGLPEIDDATCAGWLAALETEAQLAKALAGAEAAAQVLLADAAELQLSPGLLTEAGEVERLREMLGAADKSRADLPRREEAARNGRERLQRAAQALGLVGAEALAELLPGEMALVRVRDLLRKRSEMIRAREAAAARLDKAAARRRSLEQAGEQPAEDPEPLRRAFDAFSDFPAAARRLREQAAEIAENTAKLEREAQRLSPPVAFADLLRLPLPELVDIEKEIRRVASLAEAARQLDREGAALAQRIAEAEKSMQALAREGDIASPEDMRAARRLRDEAVDRLEVEPELEARERGGRFAGLRRMIADADRQADVLLGGADRAARRTQLADGLAQALTEKSALDARRDENAAQQNRFEDDWKALWTGCGFTPLAPASMRDWRVRASSLIERHEALSASRAAFLAAKAEFEEQSVALAAFAPRLGIAGTQGEVAISLYTRLRDAIAAQQKAFADGRTHAANVAAAANEIIETEKEIALLDERSAALAGDWSAALATLSLDPAAGFAEAEEGLRIWSEASADLRQFRDDDHRVETIRQDIAAFEARAAELCGQFCPDISGESARQIVETLGKRLDAARAAAASQERLAAQHSKIVREIEQRRRELSAVQAVLAAATAALGASDGELPLALARLSDRRSLRQDLAALDRDLAEAGEGLSLEQLQEEQQAIDFDSVGADIAAMDAQKDVALAEIRTSAVTEADARKALAELEAGRDAVRHAVEKEEAAAELLDIARDWLIRMAAAKLSAIAVERHRQRHQDPVIAQISGLFARSTGGAFVGTVIDYDDGDQPVLKGLRAAGERVGVEGMSEGTRDQLFLALRLALLAQRSAEPLPFIGDDLLASFDDARTGHALDMLADFGAGRQTILFTHHRHVADIAKENLGERLDLVTLD